MMEDLGPLLLIAFLIFLNGTFVAAEFAIARIRRSQVDHLAESKTESLGKIKSAKLLQKILENINDYISACQVGITISSLALGAVAEARIEKLISPILHEHLPQLNSHGVSIVIAITVITFFHVILGEIVPKNIALIHPEQVSFSLVHYLRFVHSVFKIPVAVLNACSNFCLRIVGIDANANHTVHSEDELKMILSTSQEEGILEEEEEQLMQNVFEFNDTVAKDIMVPRTDMVCLPETLSIKEATTEINKASFSRYPIYGESLDQITGYLSIKDILIAYEKGDAEASVKSISNEILTVTDGLFVIDLIELMRQKKKPMAILIDEFGGTSGLVTIEDIVEEIFGEIEDENETPKVPILKLPNGDFLVDGLVPLRELNEETGTEFESDHYDTIGGFVYGLIGSEPKRGDQVENNGYLLLLEKHSDNRIKLLRMRKL